MEFPNPDFQLKPQMFADIELKINYGNQIVVPQEAVLDSGKEQRVFVAKARATSNHATLRWAPSWTGRLSSCLG
jgi:multidrug efflux pump subunit AcrA (membrane-fusion protein)